MRKITFPLLLISLLILMILNSYAEEEKTYKHPYFNYTINYPADWSVQEMGDTLVIEPPLQQGKDIWKKTSVEITRTFLGANPPTLDEYVSSALDSAKSSPDFKLLDKGRTEIDNKDTIFIVYVEDIRTRKEYMFICGPNIFELLFWADKKDFNKYLPQAEDIMKSFRMTE